MIRFCLVVVAGTAALLAVVAKPVAHGVLYDWPFPSILFPLPLPRNGAALVLCPKPVHAVDALTYRWCLRRHGLLASPLWWGPVETRW